MALEHLKLFHYTNSDMSLKFSGKYRKEKVKFQYE